MLKKTVTILSFIFTLFILTGFSFSQTLYFCEGVDDNGRPQSASGTFYIPGGGGYFYFLVRLPYEINCTYIDYDIYDIDDYGYETFNTTVSQDGISRNWTWFWKKVTFYKSGYYHIYVRDCTNYNLTDGYVNIYFK